MSRFPIAILCLACGHAIASIEAVKPRELVHPYPGTGPAEIAGTVAANKVLRTMQRYAVPAFTDVLALHVAQTLRGESDQPVVVTRKPRQGGNEAAAYVSSAAANGRTLLLTSGFSPAAKPDMRAGIALRPVALVASMPYVLITGSDSRHANLGDFTRQARGTASRLLVGSAGEQSIGHVAVGLLRSHHRLPIEPVAYNGGLAALQAVTTKQVSTALVPLPAALPYLGGGRLKALAIAEPRRHAAIPQVQTSAEAGFSDFEAVSRFGVHAPAAAQLSVIRALDAMLARGVQSVETRQLFSELGLRLEHRAYDVTLTSTLTSGVATATLP